AHGLVGELSAGPEPLAQAHDAREGIDHLELPSPVGPGDQETAIVGPEIDGRIGRGIAPAPPTSAAPPVTLRMAIRPPGGPPSAVFCFPVRPGSGQAEIRSRRPRGGPQERPA